MALLTRHIPVRPRSLPSRPSRLAKLHDLSSLGSSMWYYMVWSEVKAMERWWSVANEWKVWWVIELSGTRDLWGGRRTEG